MLKDIPPFIIDEEKILATQELLQPLLEKIDSLRNTNLDEQGELSKWIEVRMSRYSDRLADEFKANKKEDRKCVFDWVVRDITDYASLLLKKDDIDWSDLSLLHTKLYPKGLWWQSQDSTGKKMLAKLPSGEFRTKPEFVKTSVGDFYFLPPDQISEVLDSIHEWFYSDTDLHFLLRLVLMLSFVSHVHPYYNGNGTVLYFYMAILLLKNGYPIPFAVNEYFTNPNIGRDLALCNGWMDYMPIFWSFLESFEKQ